MVELGYKFHLSNCKECAFNGQVTLLPKGGCHHPAYGDVRINPKDLCETGQPELPAAASFPSCRLQLKCHLFREDFLDYSRPRIATLHVIAYCRTLDPILVPLKHLALSEMYTSVFYCLSLQTGMSVPERRACVHPVHCFGLIHKCSNTCCSNE